MLGLYFQIGRRFLFFEARGGCDNRLWVDLLHNQSIIALQFLNAVKNYRLKNSSSYTFGFVIFFQAILLSLSNNSYQMVSV